MDGKIKNTLATVNYYYGKCWANFERDWGKEESNDWNLILDNYYLLMLKNSIHSVKDHEKIYEELEKNKGKYLNCVEKKIPDNCIAMGLDKQETAFVKLGSRYRACYGIGLNIYMITVYLYMNQREYLRTAFPDRALLIIFYLVMYDGSFVPEEICKIYERELKSSDYSNEQIKQLYREWSILLEKYFDFVEDTFPREIDASWEMGMREENDRILNRMSHNIEAIISFNSKKNISTGIKKVEK